MILSEELKWRGFVNQTTFKNISEIDEEPINFYFGVDPSAKSMTIGNLAMAIMVLHFIKAGHKATLLVGGATGLIGDPDGKTEERTIKTKEEVSQNVEGIAREYKRIFQGQDFELVNNYDWFSKINYLDFLRDVGKHVPMRQMLGRDFVQSRLCEDGAGISYAEFSYSLIQGYDFLYLYENKDITLQVAGADQWGNSIAGVDLVRRKTGAEVNIWTGPLVINKATGKKFGKSEDGAIWLDENLTSVYKFYQFWLNVDDEGVEDYIKIYTMLDKPAVDKIIAEFNADKSFRIAQKTLAFEVTKLVHGAARAETVKKISEALFGNDDQAIDNLTDNDFEELAKELGILKVPLDANIFETLVNAKLASSKSEARQFIKSGAVYLNGHKMPPESVGFAKGSDQTTNYALLRRGKNSQIVIKYI